MALHKKLTILPRRLLELLLEPRRARSMWISVMLIGVAEAIFLWLEARYHVQMYLIRLLLVPIAMTAAALGFNDGKNEPLAKLFKQSNSPAAPFMVAQTIDLYQLVSSGKGPGGGSERELIKRADSVVELFLSEIGTLKTIGKLSQSVAESIFPPDRNKPSRAVWAVCGRKERTHAHALYNACQNSHAASNHIERVFFPPDSPEDGSAIREGIEQHLLTGMTVRVFESRTKALETLYEFHLPRGFGMTWIAGDQPSARLPTRPDDPSATVFVHWGGFGGLDHHGVILKGNADWAWHLWKLCLAIQNKAEIANANEATGQVVPMTLKQFLGKYPHYGER